jgi:hypothetical protein
VCFGAVRGVGRLDPLATFLKMKVPRPWAFAFTLLFALQPYIFFYGANGMSEMISFAFTLMIVCNLTLWMRLGAPESLVRIAVGFAGLFLTRYESIPFAAAVGLGCDAHPVHRRERWYPGAAGAGRRTFTSRVR